MLDLSISYAYTSDEHTGVKRKGSRKAASRTEVGQQRRQITGGVQDSENAGWCRVGRADQQIREAAQQQEPVSARDQVGSRCANLRSRTYASRGSLDSGAQCPRRGGIVICDP